MTLSETSRTRAMQPSSRRSVLKGAAVAGIVATTGVSPATAQSSGGRTFVLIHGAWHGGWCWGPVADILRAKGHKVYTPSLTGLADRSHLLSMSINLDTHIMDIVNLFKWEDIENACLVGHSYGGWPISGAAEKLEGKIASIVFVDAFVPENGQKVMDLNSAQFQQALLDAIAKGEAGRPVPKASAFGVIDPRNIERVQAKMTPQPTGVSTQPIMLTGARDRIAKKTYIRATGFSQPNFERYYANAKAAGWHTYAFEGNEAGHDVMVDAPVRLAQILEEVM